MSRTARPVTYICTGSTVNGLVEWQHKDYFDDTGAARLSNDSFEDGVDMKLLELLEDEQQDNEGMPLTYDKLEEFPRRALLSIATEFGAKGDKDRRMATATVHEGALSEIQGWMEGTSRPQSTHRIRL